MHGVVDIDAGGVVDDHGHVDIDAGGIVDDGVAEDNAGLGAGLEVGHQGDVGGGGKGVDVIEDGVAGAALNRPTDELVARERHGFHLDGLAVGDGLHKALAFDPRATSGIHVGNIALLEVVGFDGNSVLLDFEVCLQLARGIVLALGGLGIGGGAVVVALHLEGEGVGSVLLAVAVDPLDEGVVSAGGGAEGNLLVVLEGASAGNGSHGVVDAVLIIVENHGGNGIVLTYLEGGLEAAQHGGNSVAGEVGGSANEVELDGAGIVGIAIAPLVEEVAVDGLGLNDDALVVYSAEGGGIEAVDRAIGAVVDTGGVAEIAFRGGVGRILGSGEGLVGGGGVVAFEEADAGGGSEGNLDGLGLVEGVVGVVLIDERGGHGIGGGGGDGGAGAGGVVEVPANKAVAEVAGGGAGAGGGIDNHAAGRGEDAVAAGEGAVGGVREHHRVDGELALAERNALERGRTGGAVAVVVAESEEIAAAVGLGSDMDGEVLGRAAVGDGLPRGGVEDIGVVVDVVVVVAIDQGPLQVATSRGVLVEGEGVVGGGVEFEGTVGIDGAVGEALGAGEDEAVAAEGVKGPSVDVVAIVVDTPEVHVLACEVGSIDGVAGNGLVFFKVGHEGGVAGDADGVGVLAVAVAPAHETVAGVGRGGEGHVLVVVGRELAVGADGAHGVVVGREAHGVDDAVDEGSGGHGLVDVATQGVDGRAVEVATAPAVELVAGLHHGGEGPLAVAGAGAAGLGVADGGNQLGGVDAGIDVLGRSVHDGTGHIVDIGGAFLRLLPLAVAIVGSGVLAGHEDLGVLDEAEGALADGRSRAHSLDVTERTVGEGIGGDGGYVGRQEQAGGGIGGHGTVHRALGGAGLGGTVDEDGVVGGAGDVGGAGAGLRVGVLDGGRQHKLREIRVGSSPVLDSDGVRVEAGKLDLAPLTDASAPADFLDNHLIATESIKTDLEGAVLITLNGEDVDGGVDKGVVANFAHAGGDSQRG